MVSDVRLPGLSGTEWLLELRNADAELPVILVTGHGHIARAVQAMREGAYDFLEKPFSSERLVAIVRHASERRHCCRWGDCAAAIRTETFGVTNRQPVLSPGRFLDAC